MFALKTLVITAGLLLTATATDAADKKAKKAKKPADATAALFKKLDTNNDGKLSTDEFSKLAEVKKTLKAANPKKKAKPAKAKKANKVAKPKKAGKKTDKSAALFKKLDTDNNGSLSSTEFAKLNETTKALKAANPKKKKKAKK